MSLGTYGGLKTAIPIWATRSDMDSAQLDDFAAWAHQEICRKLRANVLLTSADVTLSAETVVQPTGFEAIKRFYLDVTPRQLLLTTSAEGAADLSAQASSSTYPTHVAIEGTSFRFAPAFTGTTTVGKLLYYQAPALMTADADTNVVLLKYPYLYLYGALEALFTFLEDDNNAQIYGGRFGALIDDINTRDAKDSMGGPIQSQPALGGVV